MPTQIINSVEELSSDELSFIVDCEAPSDLSKRFDQTTRNILFKATKRNPLLALNRNKITRAIAVATDISSIPVDALWLIVSFFSLGSAIFYLAGFVALVAIAMGTVAFAQGYQKLQQAVNKDDMLFRFLELKDRAVERLSVLQKINLTPHASPQLLANPVKPWGSVLLGSTTTVILLATFFWGITDIVNTLLPALMFSAAMGPVGIGIAAAVFIGMGAFIAIKHYEAIQNKRTIENEQNRLKDALQFKVVEYHAQLQNRIVTKIFEETVAKPAPAQSGPLFKNRRSQSFSGGSILLTETGRKLSNGLSA